MKNSNFFLFLLLVALFPRSVFGLDMTDAGIFRATKNACSDASAETIRSGIFPSREYNEILKTIFEDSLKSAVVKFEFTKESVFSTSLVTNPEFRRALHECYNENSDEYRLFAKRPMRADEAGKVVGAVMQIVALRGYGVAIDGFGLLLSRTTPMSLVTANKWIAVTSHFLLAASALNILWDFLAKKNVATSEIVSYVPEKESVNAVGIGQQQAILFLLQREREKRTVLTIAFSKEADVRKRNDLQISLQKHSELIIQMEKKLLVERLN